MPDLHHRLRIIHDCGDAPNNWLPATGYRLLAHAPAQDPGAGRRGLAARRRANDGRGARQGQRAGRHGAGDAGRPRARHHHRGRAPVTARGAPGLHRAQQAARRGHDRPRPAGPADRPRPGPPPRAPVPGGAPRPRHRGLAAADQRRRLGQRGGASQQRRGEGVRGHGRRGSDAGEPAAPRRRRRAARRPHGARRGARAGAAGRQVSGFVNLTRGPQATGAPDVRRARLPGAPPGAGARGRLAATGACAGSLARALARRCTGGDAARGELAGAVRRGGTGA